MTADQDVNKSGRVDDAGETSTSLTLLDRFRAHHDDAWRRLVVLYGPMADRWCRSAHILRQDTVDVVQDVLHAVAQAIGRFRPDRPGNSFRHWLRWITTNKIRDYYRKLSESYSRTKHLQENQQCLHNHVRLF